jgi:hypothetical protein
LILLTFLMLILCVVGLTKRAVLLHVIFSDLPLFTGLLEKQSLVAKSTTEAEYIAAAPRSYGLCTS